MQKAVQSTFESDTNAIGSSSVHIRRPGKCGFRITRPPPGILAESGRLLYIIDGMPEGGRHSRLLPYQKQHSRPIGDISCGFASDMPSAPSLLNHFQNHIYLMAQKLHFSGKQSSYQLESYFSSLHVRGSIHRTGLTAGAA